MPRTAFAPSFVGAQLCPEPQRRNGCARLVQAVAQTYLPWLPQLACCLPAAGGQAGKASICAFQNDKRDAKKIFGSSE